VTSRYIRTMETLDRPFFRTLAAGLATLALAIITGLAFAGWMNHGAEIFLTYAATGLAWCL